MHQFVVVVDLERNYASASIFVEGIDTPPEVNEFFDLEFASGSIFDSESELFLCSNGEESSHCVIQSLNIFFDSAGKYNLLNLNNGLNGSFYFIFNYLNN